MKLLITYNGRDGITKVLATQQDQSTLVDDHGYTWTEDTAGRWSTQLHRKLVYAMAVVIVDP